MAASCHYHPEARSSAKCPTCHQHICDKCRMNGTADRCMSCQRIHAKGGADGTRPKREMCSNHPDVPCDMKCIRCERPYCPGCLNGAQKCFRCALRPDAPPGAAGRGTGALKGGATGSLKGKAGTGALRHPAHQPFWQTANFKQAVGSVAVVVVCFVALGAVAPMLGIKTPWSGKKAAVKPYTGTAKVEIVAPAAGRALTGNQVIKLKVAGADAIERVELTIDGKRWEHFKKPPFETDWQTLIFKNGSHTVAAKAIYRGGKKTATAKRVFTVKNKGK